MIKKLSIIQSLCVLAVIVLLASCGSTRELSDKEFDSLSTYKNDLTFSTVFQENGLEVKVINEGTDNLSMVGMVLHVIQINSERSLSSDLIEHVSKNMLEGGKSTSFSINLKELINNAFGNQAGEYAVSVSYLSDEALHMQDNRNLYYIRYNHK